MPNVYVFPGGRVGEADEWPSGFAEPLAPPPATAPLAPAELATHARAAVRETFEETGLLFGEPAAAHPAAGPFSASIWTAFAAAGLDPAFAALRLLARAVTPAPSPIRFDTYFFLADGAAARGHLAGDGELEDIGWVPVPSATRRPMAKVTRLILAEALARWAEGAAEPRDIPVISI
jgi:8-oxo-dGTP pyrophosphatase MutT (NUDIX family)